MDQFSSAEDIQTFIESHITDDVKADAKAAGAKVLQMAQDWCDNDCTSSSAEYLKGIFGHMNGGRCTDASVFCGPCANRADNYFAEHPLPCCIDDVVQKGIEVCYTCKMLSANICCPRCAPCLGPGKGPGSSLEHSLTDNII